MSYLLKALQKAEQERQQTVQVENDAPVLIQQKSSLPVGLVLVVVLLLLVTLWQVWPNKADSNADEWGESTSQIAKPTQTIEPLNAEELVLPSTQLENTTESDHAVNPVTILAKPKDLSELTSQDLARIPSLNLASHIYSSAAEFRSVVINDQAYKEGALIRAGLILEEINQSGIVINIHGQRVELPKGISWVASQDAK